ncbi:MAG: transposase, partial [Desulfomonilaceae bacterium]
MEKRLINVKELLADIKAGMDDAALEQKYQLTAYQLKTLFEQLVKKGSLQAAELYNREPVAEKPPTTEWECPVCHTPLSNEFEVCPKCKVYVPKFWKVQPDKRDEKEGERAGEDRSSIEKPVALPRKCPACGMPQFKEYEECPQCGVVVAKFRSRQPPEQETPETLVPEPSSSPQSGEEGGATENFRVSQERTGPASSFFDDRRLLGLLGAGAVIRGFFQPLTDERREDVLILDDTPYDRSRSKEVELLSRVRDHGSKRYLKGFRMLTLGWSDGASFVPVDHVVLSSTKKKNRIQGITKEMDRRTCGARRRQEALCKSTDLIVPMIRRALGILIHAKYVLMDSWFGFPAVVRSLMSYIDVICMVKNTPKIFYDSEGQSLTLSHIYRKIRKRRGRAQIKGSVTVGIGEGKLAKLVFVRRRYRESGSK